LEAALFFFLSFDRYKVARFILTDIVGLQESSDGIKKRGG
jgi:hypothetical protein